MKRKIWISTLAGSILVFATAANMSNNPSQSPSDDSVVINDWLIVGEPHPTAFTPGEGALMAGGGNKAEGQSSVALGSYNTASNHGSVAIGFGNTSSSFSSLAIGEYAISSGTLSFAMGYHSAASGMLSFAMGSHLNAYGYSTTVVGRYNESTFADASDSSWAPNEDGHLFVVGNGTLWNDRSNAMVVYHDGAVDVGKNDTDDTVPLQVTADGSVILAKEQGDISMGAFGN